MIPSAGEACLHGVLARIQLTGGVLRVGKEISFSFGEGFFTWSLDTVFGEDVLFF